MTYKNGMRLQDSEFLKVVFAGRGDVIIGGQSGTEPLAEEGQIAQVAIHTNRPIVDSLTRLMFDEAALPDDVFLRRRPPAETIGREPTEVLADSFNQASLVPRGTK
jgi:hypothetical protein